MALNSHDAVRHSGALLVLILPHIGFLFSARRDVYARTHARIKQSASAFIEAEEAADANQNARKGDVNARLWTVNPIERRARCFSVISLKDCKITIFLRCFVSKNTER